jgi:hypothetical protein
LAFGLWAKKTRRPMIGVRIRDTKKLPQKPNLRDFPRYPIKAEMRTSGRIAILHLGRVEGEQRAAGLEVSGEDATERVGGGTGHDGDGGHAADRADDRDRLHEARDDAATEADAADRGEEGGDDTAGTLSVEVLTVGFADVSEHFDLNAGDGGDIDERKRHQTGGHGVDRVPADERVSV